VIGVAPSAAPKVEAV